MLGISLLGGLAGIDSFSGLGDYAEMHFEALSKHFELPHGAPSHDTFQRLFDALEPEQFHECFFTFTQNGAYVLEGVIAMDGKSVRNSGKQGALHLVNAWCEANELVLAQQKVNIGNMPFYSGLAITHKSLEKPPFNKTQNCVLNFVNGVI